MSTAVNFKGTKLQDPMCAMIKLSTIYKRELPKMAATNVYFDSTIDYSVFLTQQLGIVYTYLQVRRYLININAFMV